jgi:hypothetical protein
LSKPIGEQNSQSNRNSPFNLSENLDPYILLIPKERALLKTSKSKFSAFSNVFLKSYKANIGKDSKKP